MPFGMINSGATLTCYIRKLLAGLDYVSPYRDDFLVHTHSWEDHMITLRELLERLVTANPTVRPSRCWIGWDWVELLGQEVGHRIQTPPLNWIDKVLNTPF